MLTLAAPVLLLAIVLAFAIVRTAINANLARRHHPPDSEVSWYEEFVAREHQAAKKATATATSVFVMASIFFFRSCLKPFKCEDDGTGALFMVSNPEVECGDNDKHQRFNGTCDKVPHSDRTQQPWALCASHTHQLIWAPN